MAFPKYGTHPIKCGSGKCKWIGYETEQIEAPGEIDGVDSRENVCPKCGHNTYGFMTEKQMKKAGLKVKKTDIKEYQKRVVEEKKELEEKADRLVEFLNSPMIKKVDSEEGLRMREQLWHMRRYAAVLSERIAAFE